MTSKEFDAKVQAFVTGFNAMCQSERRDFLVRERIFIHESGPSARTYAVNYVVKKRGNSWKVIAETRGWWFFKKKFPLMTIRRGEGKVALSGLYTKDYSQFDEAELEAKLKDYTAYCKSLPHNAFVKS